MAYSQEEINQLKNQLLEVSRSSSPNWSAVDDAIYNSFWESNKDKPEVVLNFPILGTPPEKQEKGPEESTKEETSKSGQSPFSIRNGVVNFNGVPVDQLTPEQQRQAYGLAGNPQFLNFGGAAVATDESGNPIEYSEPRKPSDLELSYWEPVEEIDPNTGEVTTSYRINPNYSQWWEVRRNYGDDSGNTSDEIALKPEAYQRLTGRGLMQTGIPRSFGGEGEFKDPSQIFWDEEFGWVTPTSNYREYSGSVFTPGMMLLLAGGLGAIGLAGGFSGLGSALGFGEAAAAGVAEGAAASGAASGATTGLGQYAAMTTGLDGAIASGIGAGTGATTATGIGAGGATLGQYAGMTTGLDGLSAASLTAGGGASNIAATTAALGGAGAGTGSGILGGVGEWFSSLSPTAQRAITSAVSQGASAVMAGRRQESAQDFARQQQERQYDIRRQEEERAMEERRIRGTPSAFTFNVTPRSGIVGSSMGGG